MKTQLVVDDLDDVVLRKLLKMKDNDQFTSKTWGEWFSFLTRDVFLNDSAGEMIQKSTRENLLRTWCSNLADNLPSIREMDTIRGLAPPDSEADKICGPAVVVGRGPSLFKYQHLKLLGESGFKGVVVASDGVLIECLKNGVVPNYVVSVDGNRDLIWKWYDHPLVAANASRIASILCVTVANNVLKHIQKIGMKIYWFNPQFDDWRRNESFTKLQMLLTASEKNPNGAANCACLGNAGATAWVMSHALLRRSPIALIGMDMGYLPDTPPEETSYYKAMMEGTGGNVNLVMQSFGKVHNPFFNVDAVNDAVFRQYRDSFLSALGQINPQIRTVNCFAPGTMITSPIPLPIEQKPEVVIGHDGQMHKVSRFYERLFNGSLLKIGARGILPINCTGEHPFLSIRMKDSNDDRQRRYNLHQARKFRPIWRLAKDLRPWDLLLMTYGNFQIRRTFLRLKNGRSIKNPIPSTIKVTKDLLWLIGLYAADGGRGDSNSGSISLEVDSSVKIERCRSVFKEVFHKEVIVKEYPNHVRINIHSADIMDNLTDWCGLNCYDKHIPPFSLGSPDVLEGIADGDGHRSVRTSENTVISSVSRTLITQIQQTLLRLGQHPSVRQHVRKAYHGTYPNAVDLYEVEWGNGSWHYTRWWSPSKEDNVTKRPYYLTPIRNISNVPYNGSVYNLEIENAHSYMVNGVIVHNCTEGGCLFSEDPKCSLEYMRFADWLKLYGDSG